MAEPAEREPMSDELLAEALACFSEYTRSHDHAGAFACCSAHAAANWVDPLLRELKRTRDELAARLAAESANAAAGSYAGRAEEAEAEAERRVHLLAGPDPETVEMFRLNPGFAAAKVARVDDEAKWLRARHDGLVARAENAEAARDEWHRQNGHLRGERDAATARAEQAEAALAEVRERLGEAGETRLEWGVRTRDDDPDEDIEVVSSEAIAREFATTWRSEIPDANPTAMCRTARTVGSWRVAAAAPHAALECAADEQGVQAVGDISELAAAEDGRPSDEEFAAFDQARRDGGGDGE